MRRKWIASMVLGALAFGGLGVSAADAAYMYDLEPVTVTATRVEEKVGKVPASVSVVTAEQIQQKNIRTLTEAIGQLPGVYNGRPQGMSDVGSGIQVRGFGESNVLVLYDGIPINNGYDGGANWSTVSINDVQKIELLRGAASSLYGGRAVGGVVNIVSKNPDKTGGRVYAEYGSNKTWRRGVSASYKVDDKWSFGVGYENRRTDGYKKKLTYTKKGRSKTPSGTVGTGFEATENYAGVPIYVLGYPGKGASKDNTYNFKLKYNFSDNKSMIYRYTHDNYKYFAKGPVSFIHDADGHQLFEGSVLLPDGKYYNFDESDFTDYYGRRKSDVHAFTYRDDDHKILFNAGLTNIKDSGYSTGSDFAGRGPGSDARYPSKSYKADFQKTWEFGRNTLVGGFDIQRDSMIYTKRKLAHWHDWNSGTSRTLQVGGKNLVMAAFVQDKYQFNDQWGMYAGLRFDHYKKYDGFFKGVDHKKYTEVTQEDKDYNELSPKLAFEYKPDDASTYYISYGHSFKAPSLYQLYRHDPSYGYVANPGLDPETTNTFEIGAKKTFDRTQVNFDVYHAKTKDMIIASAKDAEGHRKYINEDEATRDGMELEVRHQFNDALSAYANYAWERAHDKEGKRLYSIPQHVFHAGVEYQKPEWNAYLEAQYISSRNARDEVAHRLYSEDEVYTINLGANYQFAKGATIGFAINNLLDRDYWAWQYADGRTYTVKLSYEF